MPKWLSVVIVIIVFFVVAGTYERWRVNAMDAWCRARDFTRIVPFVPADHPAIPRLLSGFTARNDWQTRRYASAVTGMAGKTNVTMVEFEYRPSTNSKHKWYTLTIWQGAAPAPGSMVLTPPAGKFLLIDDYLGWVTEGLLTPSRADQLLTQVPKARRILE